MKAIQLATKILFAIFFVICIAVHIVGPFTQISNEPLWSHIVHAISYCICLYVLLIAGTKPNDKTKELALSPPSRGACLPERQGFRRGWIYIAAACYPFVFHANCAWHSYFDYNKLNAICLLVIVMMPLAGLFIWNMEREISR
jgi:hypothetical protein